MSISNLTVKATYVGDGANTTFAIPHANVVDDSAEVKVYIRDESTPTAITEALQTEGALQDYTLTGAPDASSFHTDVEFNTAPASTDKVIVIRELPLTQPLDLTNAGNYSPAALELAYDRAIAMIQQLNEILTRVPRLSITEQKSEANMTLPVTIPENGIWGFDGTDGMKFWTPAELLEEVEDVEIGAGYGDKESDTLTDGQSATNVTGMTMDSSTETSARWFVEVKVTSTAGTKFLTGHVVGHYNGSAYSVHKSLFEGDIFQADFTIDAGQVKLALGTLGGTGFSGTIKFKRMVLEA